MSEEGEDQSLKVAEFQRKQGLRPLLLDGWRVTLWGGHRLTRQSHDAN